MHGLNARRDTLAQGRGELTLRKTPGGRSGKDTSFKIYEDDEVTQWLENSTLVSNASSDDGDEETAEGDAPQPENPERLQQLLLTLTTQEWKLTSRPDGGDERKMKRIYSITQHIRSQNHELALYVHCCSSSLWLFLFLLFLLLDSDSLNRGR